MRIPPTLVSAYFVCESSQDGS